jgi:hypothetical protein
MLFERNRWPAKAIAVWPDRLIRLEAEKSSPTVYTAGAIAIGVPGRLELRD